MEHDCETALGLELVAKLEQQTGLPSLKTLQSRDSRQIGCIANFLLIVKKGIFLYIFNYI